MNYGLGLMLGALLVGCGGTKAASPQQGPSGDASSGRSDRATTMEGTWDIVFGSGPYASGVLEIAEDGATLSLVPVDRHGRDNCTSASIRLDMESGMATVDADCATASSSFERKGRSPSRFGDFGGSWADSTGTHGCSILFSGGTFAASCADSSVLGNGSVSGTRSDDGNLVTGRDRQQQDFTAVRRD